MQGHRGYVPVHAQKGRMLYAQNGVPASIMIGYESNLCVNHGLQSSQIVRSPDYDEEGEEDTVLDMCFASRHKLCNIPCSTYYVIEDIYK